MTTTNINNHKHTCTRVFIANLCCVKHVVVARASCVVCACVLCAILCVCVCVARACVWGVSYVVFCALRACGVNVSVSVCVCVCLCVPCVLCVCVCCVNCVVLRVV